MVVANGKQDKVSDVLAALQAYQLSIPAPPPPEGSFNHAQAQRGKVLFKAKGCANCHSGPYFTDANQRLHPPTASAATDRSEEHTSELQSLLRISYDGFCLYKKKYYIQHTTTN